MKAAAGIGLRAPHLVEIDRDRPKTGFLEIHAENYLSDSPAFQIVESGNGSRRLLRPPGQGRRSSRTPAS